MFSQRVNGTTPFKESKIIDDSQKFVTWWKGSFPSSRQNVFCWWSIIWWWLWKTIFVFSRRRVVLYSAQPVRGNRKFWKADPPAAKASILPPYATEHEQFLLLYTIIKENYGTILQNSKIHLQMLDIQYDSSIPYRNTAGGTMVTAVTRAPWDTKRPCRRHAAVWWPDRGTSSL